MDQEQSKRQPISEVTTSTRNHDSHDKVALNTTGIAGALILSVFPHSLNSVVVINRQGDEYSIFGIGPQFQPKCVCQSL